MFEHKLTFSPEQDEEFFQQLPNAPAVFALRGTAVGSAVPGPEGQPYVSKTANLRRRLQRLLRPPAEQSKRLNLRDRVHEVEFTATGSEFESQFLLYRILREVFPKTYAARLRLRPAPLIKLHLENEYPRASVTTRLGRLEKVNCGATGASPVQRDDGTGGEARVSTRNLYYGPFRSRTVAEKFANDALDFFKMRRCVDDLHPDPGFPGCVYSEMKMCLAPCFKGCTDSEYRAEVARVQAFFDTSGESLSREFHEQRERASAELAFEEAAGIHAKLEKLKPLTSQLPEIVRRIDRLHALIVLPATEKRTVALFRVSAAALAGPVLFKIEMRAESRSMESQVEEIIASFPASTTKSAGERTEHLAILKRWYYRSVRVGEIFFADENGSWPLRRIVRGIGRVCKGENVQDPVTFSATPDSPPPS